MDNETMLIKLGDVHERPWYVHNILMDTELDQMQVLKLVHLKFRKLRLRILFPKQV